MAERAPAADRRPPAAPSAARWPHGAVEMHPAFSPLVYPASFSDCRLPTAGCPAPPLAPTLAPAAVPPPPGRARDHIEITLAIAAAGLAGIFAGSLAVLAFALERGWFNG